MPGKLYKIHSHLKRIFKKQDRIWERIGKDYRDALKIQKEITITYDIMCKHHTNMEYIFDKINKPYDAIIRLGENVKEGKMIINYMRGTVMNEGLNFGDIKLKRESDNQDLKKIIKTMKEVHNKVQYQNELIRKTSSVLYTERKQLKDNFEYMSIIGSNSKVPEIQKNLEETRRYVSAGLEAEGAIKARLETTENQLSDIDKLSTSAYKVKREKEIIEERDNGMEESRGEESVSNLSTENSKERVNEDKLINETRMASDANESRAHSEDDCQNMEILNDSEEDVNKYDGKSVVEVANDRAKRDKKERKADSNISVIRVENEECKVEKGHKYNKKKLKALPETQSKPSPETKMLPTIAQVCNDYGLNDVDLEYKDDDFINLTSYKLFQQRFRPRIHAENPGILMHKLMILVAAKWRQFTAIATKKIKGSEDFQEGEEDNLKTYEEVRKEEVTQKDKEHIKEDRERSVSNLNERSSKEELDKKGNNDQEAMIRINKVRVNLKNIGCVIPEHYY